MNERKTIYLEQGWEFMEKGITKLKNILEGRTETQFSSEDYTMFYTTIYNMCTQKPPHDYSKQLYDKYKETFEEYITHRSLDQVLPSIREKHDEFMLRELVKRWGNHKVMVRWLSRNFNYLDRYFIARRSLSPLNEVGVMCFRELVYQELKIKVRDVVISLIDQEREGEQIDRALLKNVLDIFVEIGMGQMEDYENDFEEAMLKDTAAYYSRKASSWILEDSCPDYMLKAEECLKREKDRVSHYLHSSSEPKLLEKVQHELLSIYANQLLEKKHSGCHALLRDEKVEDLSRMFRLFSTIPKGLDLVAGTFKQHVTAEGTTLVKQAEDATSNKKIEAKRALSREEQQTNARAGYSNPGRGSGGGEIKTKKIFVGGLPPTLTEDEFRQYFENYGNVTDVVIMYDQTTQRPRGFGFISFDSEEAVDRVLHKKFHDMSGNKVEVKRALPKGASPYGSSRNMGGGGGRGATGGRYGSAPNGGPGGEMHGNRGGYASGGSGRRAQQQ